MRHCEKTCTIEDVTIVKGARVLIPIYTLHHSSEYWKEPEQFIPERFDYSFLLSFSELLLIFSFHPDEKAKRHPLVYIPFGFVYNACRSVCTDRYRFAVHCAFQLLQMRPDV